jgi:hypothetical protein
MSALLGLPIDAAYRLVSALAGVLAPLPGGLAAAAAIVAFTIMVRLLVLPLGYYAFRGERARDRLTPRVQELYRRHSPCTRGREPGCSPAACRPCCRCRSSPSCTGCSCPARLAAAPTSCSGSVCLARRLAATGSPGQVRGAVRGWCSASCSASSSWSPWSQSGRRGAGLRRRLPSSPGRPGSCSGHCRSQRWSSPLWCRSPLASTW